MILSTNKYENIISAPIAGYTNWPLRRLFSKFGASRIFSEMVHVREIFHKEHFELPFLNIDYNFTIQLFGSVDDDFISAGELVLKFCDNIDINCGCPAKKVIKAGGGSFWLKDIDKFSKKIFEISSRFPYKVSVKIRLGFTKPQIAEILDSIKEAKLAFITVHMRTAQMLFSGKAMYQYADSIKNYKTQIILNGDISDPFFAKEVLDNYDCSGIMIGRAAIIDPSIFKKINEFLSFGSYFEDEKLQRINNCIDYIDNLLIYLDFYPINNKETKDEIAYLRFLRNSIVESRKILFSISKKIPFSNKIREKILKILNREDLFELKEEFSQLKSNFKL